MRLQARRISRSDEQMPIYFVRILKPTRGSSGWETLHIWTAVNRRKIKFIFVYFLLSRYNKHKRKTM